MFYRRPQTLVINFSKKHIVHLGEGMVEWYSLITINKRQKVRVLFPISKICLICVWNIQVVNLLDGLKSNIIFNSFSNTDEAEILDS